MHVLYCMYRTLPVFTGFLQDTDLRNSDFDRPALGASARLIHFRESVRAAQTATGTICCSAKTATAHHKEPLLTEETT